MTDRFPSPDEALGEAQVDLHRRIKEGIPERTFVPGAAPWLIAKKRYLWAGSAGSGKSLGVVVVSADILEAGGTVAIIDAENGPDEYALRLSAVLGARGSSAIADALDEGRLRYYDSPRVLMAWSEEEWAEAFEGVDVVFLDSSRLLLDAVGLREDSNDDFAKFAGRFLMPLSKAGIATVLLDNTGHSEAERARGAKAKEDLNEVVYLVRPGAPFGREQAGHLRLTLTRSRFSDLPAELELPVGGDSYGPMVVAGDADADHRDELLEAIRSEPGRTTEALAKAVNRRRSGTASRLKKLEDAGTAYRAPSQITDGAGRSRSIKGWFPAVDGGSHPVPQAGTPGTAGHQGGQSVPPSPPLRGGTGDRLDPADASSGQPGGRSR
jgi:hypothetical protein